MSRNIFENNEVEEVPLPEFVEPVELPAPEDGSTVHLPSTTEVVQVTDEEIQAVKNRIKELEAEENLDGLNTTILNNLRAGLAALGHEG